MDTDADGTVLAARPASIAVTITAEVSAVDATATFPDGLTWSEKDGKKYTATTTLKGNADAAKWTKVINTLPKLDSKAQAITYTVSEDQLPNYAEPSVTNVGNVWTIINTYERTTFTGTKVWDDGKGAHDNPTELEGKLTVQCTTTPDVATSWTGVTRAHIHWNTHGAVSGRTYTQSFTITGLPAKAANGDVYTYRVVETQVAGYQAPTYTNNGSDAAKTDALYNGGSVTNAMSVVMITPKFIKKAEGMPAEITSKDFSFLLAPQTNNATFATDNLDK